MAKVHDYTAITVIDGTDPKDCRVVYTERFNNKPYSFVVERVLGVSLQYGAVRVLVDETGVGAGVTDQIVSELPVAEGFAFSNASKISLINTLKTGLEQRRIKISNANTKLLDELRYYEYELSDAGNIKMSAPSGKHDDMVISLALAYQKCAVIYSDPQVVAIPAQSQSLNTPAESPITLLGNSRTENEGVVVI